MTVKVVWGEDAFEWVSLLQDIDPDGLTALFDDVEQLEVDIRPPGSFAPWEANPLFRLITSGRYTALYNISDDGLTAVVVRVGRVREEGAIRMNADPDPDPDGDLTPA